MPFSRADGDWPPPAASRAGCAAAEAIRAPTLLHGASTQPNVVAVIEALQPHIRGAGRSVIPDATHGLPQENPEASNAAVLDFLVAR